MVCENAGFTVNIYINIKHNIGKIHMCQNIIMRLVAKLSVEGKKLSSDASTPSPRGPELTSLGDKRCVCTVVNV